LKKNYKQMKIKKILETIQKKNPGENEFIQAVSEVFESISPYLEEKDLWLEQRIPERLAEPERIFTFKVTWTDDKNQVQVNRGFRVQMNSAIGPYKGGLRFHPTTNLSILKFLAFEQTFKNSLTGLPLGAGKGGADFDPKGKSDAEVMRFCQAWMQEAHKFLGQFTDIPAGDIGVGEREIGYLFGAYKKLTRRFEGVLTGKGLQYGGSYLRPEATGYGLIHFAQNMMESINESLEDKVCLVSGAGNVSQFAIEKLLEEGAKVVAFSDSSGFIHDKGGVDKEKLAFLKSLKNEKREGVEGYAKEFKSAIFYKGKSKSLWEIDADCAFPCATQNEVDEKAVKAMAKNKLILLAEGANMPLTQDAIDAVQASKILYGPGKASNAGGVGISGLEMTQNRLGRQWTKLEMEQELRIMMWNIHTHCMDTIKQYGLKEGDYLTAANIYGFKKVGKAMIAQGLV
jgi:glutamate dehydrogenase (NADP+)